MSKTSPTLVITDTDRLSAVADAIMPLMGNSKVSKNTLLNKIARELLQENVNWGGLKAMSSPVQASPLAECAQAPAVARPHEGKDRPLQYTITESKMVFFIPLHGSAKNTPVAIDVAEIPGLKEALFGNDATYSSYTIDCATFRYVAPDKVIVTLQHQNETLGEISLDSGELKRFLSDHYTIIRDAIISDGAIGEQVYDAFVETAKNSGVDMLYEIAQEFPGIEQEIHNEGDEANQARVELACRNATWGFLADAGYHIERRTAIQQGRWKELVNVVIEYEWASLGDAIENDLQDMANPHTG